VTAKPPGSGIDVSGPTNALMQAGVGNTILDWRAYAKSAEQKYTWTPDARNDSREAERNRQRDRVEHVGEILEAMASATESAPRRFAVHRNRLGLALASLRKQLPKCSALFDEAMTPDQFKSFDISAARQEIDDTLISLSDAERDDAQRTSRVGPLTGTETHSLTRRDERRRSTDPRTQNRSF
jgi:hypothetical protein